MIELELMLNDLQKIREKEKSIKHRVLLEKVIIHLKEYEKSVISKQDILASSNI